VGNVEGAAANAIATEAKASIDFRLVPRQTPEHIRQRVESHLVANGWYVTHAAPTDQERLSHKKVVRLVWGGGDEATRVSADSPVAAALIGAMDEAKAGLGSCFGSWRLVSFWERALIPTVGWFIRGAVDLDAINDPGRPEAFANGQLLCVRREAYLDAGGQLYFCGRKAHVVSTPDRTFHSVPVENVFNRHPQVRRSALIEVAGGPALAIEPASWPLTPQARLPWAQSSRKPGQLRRGHRSHGEPTPRREPGGPAAREP
jgi:hypothetical protein